MAHITLVATLCLIMAARPAPDVELESHTITVDGVPREYLEFAPHRTAQAQPLVVLLHGHGGSARQLVGANGERAPFRHWLALAEREGFVLVVPQGLRGADRLQGWNDCRADTATNPSSNDVHAIVAMVDAVEHEIPIDRRRVFAAGMSNGAQMALRLATEAPDRFSAVAAVAGSTAAQSKCEPPARAVRVLFMNGTADPIMPYTGGAIGGSVPKRGTVVATDDAARAWARLDAAEGDPHRTDVPDRDAHDGSRVSRTDYLNRSGEAVVVLYRIDGGGHAEPSPTLRYGQLYTRFAGRQNADIEAADEIWGFFRADRATATR